MARCKLCGAEIKWVRTVGGKTMPCDPQRVYYRIDHGSLERVVTPNGDVFSCVTIELDTEDISIADGWGYIPHFATCKGGIDE